MKLPIRTNFINRGSQKRDGKRQNKREKNFGPSNPLTTLGIRNNMNDKEKKIDKALI